MFDTRGMVSAVRSFDPDEDADGVPAALHAPRPISSPPSPTAEGYVQHLARLRPTTLAHERTLPVAEELAHLLPRGVLTRGSVVGVNGPGAVSLTAALVAATSQQGSWSAWIACADLGWAAVAAAGVDLARVVAVPEVPVGKWATVAAALVEAVDVVVAAPTRMVRAVDARRLTARVRERDGVLVVMAPSRRWPYEPDVDLRCEGGRWEGLGRGHGHLRSRRLTVVGAGRRGAARQRHVDLALPS